MELLGEEAGRGVAGHHPPLAGRPGGGVVGHDVDQARMGRTRSQIEVGLGEGAMTAREGAARGEHALLDHVEGRLPRAGLLAPIAARVGVDVVAIVALLARVTNPVAAAGEMTIRAAVPVHRVAVVALLVGVEVAVAAARRDRVGAATLRVARPRVRRFAALAAVAIDHAVAAARRRGRERPQQLVGLPDHQPTPQHLAVAADPRRTCRSPFFVSMMSSGCLP